MQIRIIAIIGLLVTMVGCNNDSEQVTIDYGYDYYPLDIGIYRQYDVLEVNYNALGPDTSLYQLQERIIDSIGTQDPVFLIERAKRSSSSDPWQVDSVWTTRMTEDYAVVAENNVEFQKLKFPVRDSLTWDGNAFNTLSQQTYRMSLGDSDTSQLQVLEVIISDIPENLVLQDERSEFYFRGVGLVSKDYVSLRFCTQDCGATQEIDGGRILKQTLIAYGQE